MEKHMQFTLENVGIIKKADIKLDGLTVIAGNNDTGKSTIGKVLFSIIKSISRYKEDLEEDKEKNIKQIVDRIYFILRRKINFNQNNTIKDMFYPISFMEDISKNNIEAIAYNAKMPWYSKRMKLREYLAKVKAVLDIQVLKTKPKFLGKKIEIPT